KDGRQLVAKRISIRLGREIAAFASPSGHRPDDASDQLTNARLAVGGAEVAAEVFGYDDVRGHLRPELRHLDVSLFEDDFSALIGDDGGAELPFAGVEHVDARFRIEAVDGDAAGLRFFLCFWRFRVRACAKRVGGDIDG